MAALEQLSLASGPQQPGSSPAAANNGRQLVTLDDSPKVGSDESPKVGRLPRWTRQEILVLIQGKRVAENRVRRGRSAGLALGSSGQVEPKWASVSSYCKRHGVNRGPVQCRKRWSNLAGDFKKIKEWESRIRDETDSFWLMRNDLRRERKLPGFFDKEVFDILDGGAAPGAAAPDEELELALAPSTEDPVFDSGRSAGPDDGLFSDDFEPQVQIPIPIPISEKQYQPFSESHQHQHQPPPPPPDAGTSLGAGGEGKKRKRHAVGEDEGEGEGEDEGDEEEEEDAASKSVHAQLIKVMEKNGKLLSSQLESHNIHLQLEREQRKDHVNNLISVLHKLADAMGRIADKL